MGYCRTRKLHVKYFPKVAKKSLNFFKGFLSFVGKPFYFLLLATANLVVHTNTFIKDLFSIKRVLLKLLATIRSHISRLFKKQISLLNKTSKRFIKFFKNTRVLLIGVYTPHFSKKNTLLLSIFASAIIGASTFVWTVIFEDLPSARLLAFYEPATSSKIYDRNGNLLYKIYKDENRTPVKLEDLPKEVILSTLAIEDNEFYRHHGFSLKGIARAAIKDIKENKMEGGSTITQQLVKNILLSSEKSIIRKIKEVVLAVQAESIYSKNEILEMYLNEVPYGGTAYGIQEASQKYFGKDAKNLSLAEAAALAGLPKSPSKYSSQGGDSNSIFVRQKEVLTQMLENSFINQDEYKNALKEELTFKNPQTVIAAPHFVMFTKNYLEEKFGKEILETGGLKITTTLDMNIQKMVEEVVDVELKKLTGYRVGNAAVIVIEPKSGNILAMAGSKDFFDESSQGQVNVLTTLQQPGSSIKVINYAYALSHGYQANTIIDDSPVTYQVKGSPPYSPKNYDGKYRGRITLRSAFAESRNIPAVRVLESYGVDKMIDLGQRMGITTWNDPKDYGLSITLGGGDIKLYDLAQGYSVIANYGRRVDLSPIQDVSDGHGKVLLDNKNAEGEQIIDPRAAYILTDILKDNNARSPAFGRNSQLNIEGHKEVAVKTGTSNNLRDNLAIGYNQDYLVAVWVGNNDNSPMARIASGITGATPIFNKIMTELLKEKESLPWEIPNGVKKAALCYTTKKPDSDEVMVKQYEEWFLEENLPKNVCSAILLHSG